MKILTSCGFMWDVRRVATGIALIVACAIGAGLLLVSANAEAAYADSVVEVYDIDGLKSMKADSKGVTYKLMADIDLAGEEWTPVGSPSKYNDERGSGFKGTFDGNGYTVSNFKISKFLESNGILYAGFFGCTNGATIKNLTLQNVEVKGSYSKTGSGNNRDLMVGSLIGLAVETNVSNCNAVNISIADENTGNRNDTSNYAIGGLVGDFYLAGSGSSNAKLIADCSVTNGMVVARARFGAFGSGGTPTQAFTGGVVGRLRERGTAPASLVRCFFDGTVSGSGFVGPFAGGARSKNDEGTAEEICNLAASRSERSYYQGQLEGLVSDTAPSSSYNCGKAWVDGVYLKDRLVGSETTLQEALDELNGSGSVWRIAQLTELKPVLVLDYRAVELAEPVYDQQVATIAAIKKGLYGSEERSYSLKWILDNKDQQESSDKLSASLTANDQVVVVQLRDAAGAVVREASITLPGMTVDVVVQRQRDSSGNVTSINANVENVPAGFEVKDFTFTWYGLDTSGEWVEVSTGATLNSGKFSTYETFKVVASCSQPFELTEEKQTSVKGRTVYLSIKGSNTSSGYEPNQPVATFARAYEQLADDQAGGTRDNNVIVVMDEYTNLDYGKNDGNTFNKPATVTSYDKDYNVDYQQKGAYLRWYASVGSDETQQYEKLLYADTTFDHITFDGGNGKVGYLYCQGNDLTMGDGVRMQEYRNSSKGQYGQLSGSASADFNIVGGYASFSQAGPSSSDSCDIVVKSGSYARVIAGCRSWRVNNTTHNQFGSEDNPFNVNILVDLSVDNSQVGSDSYNCDIAQVCGGQTDGTIYANSSVTINSGVIPMVLGSSIGYPRSVGGGCPNNDFVGTCSVTLNGGHVTQLYGGCLGRHTSGNNPPTADSRFLSFSNASTNAPDIAVAINGGTVGEISGIKASAGVFAAGAGGPSGAIDSATGAVSNEVDVLLAIRGGTIGSESAPAEVYGGGYGYSSGVSSGSKVNLEAGNIYGSATTVITGGTVYADVYGGGAGTEKYLGRNTETNQLAQIIGDVAMQVSNTVINGSVYGGAKGVVSTVADCSNMAKITGNAALSISDSIVTGSVYGGSAYGSVTGSVSSILSKVEVRGSVYGAGRGDDEPKQRAVDQQKAIGYVGSGATLLVEGCAVGGSVYGGGEVGCVDGAAETRVVDTTVAGSVYGGGEGDVISNTDPAMQILAGYVNGTAKLTVENSKVSEDIYGGGSVGAVADGAAVDIKNSVVTGSVFGGGEGEHIEEDETSLDLQKVVGQVVGSVHLSLTGDSATGMTVGGNVYGGGKVGVVGDGGLSTGTVPYTVVSSSDVSVFVNKVAIGGSIYGAGMGDAKVSGQTSRLLGALFGSTLVTVREATVGSDVFGGGDQSFSYAPLDASGQPKKAATVVINGGSSIYVNENDGSVASALGEGVREVDQIEASQTESRTIRLGGSVFGGGNISDPHSTSASGNTVFGSTEVFVKGYDVSFVNSVNGGIYGDGNLSTVHGKRYVTLVDLREPESSSKINGDKSFFSLQRADRAVVHNSSVFLKGARDRVNEGDTTYYSLNRVESLNLYHGSTVQFDTVVNGLGNLYSDVLSERTFTSEYGTLPITGYGDNVTNAEKEAYRAFLDGGSSAESWRDANGSSHSTANTIVVNNGKWLDVKESVDMAGAQYGQVTGLFSLVSSTASDGGTFVFGSRNPDSTGTFISLNKTQAETGGETYLDLYTQSTADADGQTCRAWFVKGKTYTYERELKAYTTSADAKIQVLLPVEAKGTQSPVLTLDNEADAGGIAIDSTLKNLQTSSSAGGYYSASMELGSGTKTSQLPFYEGQNQTWNFDCGPSMGTSSQALLPAIISLQMNVPEDVELDEQSGLVSFNLKSSTGETYIFKIKIIIEKSYAIASQKAHYGSVYESIAVENKTPISPTSSYTTQFTTTYSPGAYRSAIKTVLSSYTKKDVHGQNNNGQDFPSGTKITMVDISNPSEPAYYYYECKESKRDISLEEFVSLSDAGSRYHDRTGNTVITENLLIIVDYSNAREGKGQNGNSTTISLNHQYGSGTASKDILVYKKQSQGEEGEQHYNTLWNEYDIANNAKNDSYIKAELLNPSTDVKKDAVVPGHSSDYMYDTYTTKLRVEVSSNYVDTAYSNRSLTLALYLGQVYEDNRQFSNYTFPVGMNMTVKRAGSDEALPVRYYHAEKSEVDEDGSLTGVSDRGRGYYLVDLGAVSSGDSEYVVELSVSRYASFGMLTTAFAATRGSSDYFLYADLYGSAEGLSFGEGGIGNTLARGNASFKEQTYDNRRFPVYDIKSTSTTGKLLQSSNGKVQGTINTTNATADDVQMTVLRKAAGSAAAPQDITAWGGTVTRQPVINTGIFQHVARVTTFNISDTPEPGTYVYEIRLGNTVYALETVTVS